MNALIKKEDHVDLACLFGMLLIPGTGNGERGTGNGEPGTGVWELMYSGNPLENSKWRSKQKKGSKRNNLGKGEFAPAVLPRWSVRSCKSRVQLAMG